MKAIRLKTEHLFEPLGIDISRPRLFWNCAEGKAQNAYRILAEDSLGNLLWDSGRIDSAAMRARWGGSQVPPRTRVIWKLCLWDELGSPGEWSQASFETGLPPGEPWQAAWIAGSYRAKRARRYPVDCFMKTFESRDVQKARLYITACGLYTARVNGKPAGDFVLSPGITDYRKRIQYQTLDVGRLLLDGQNTLEVWLADGWYRGSTGAWGIRNQYGHETKLLAQLELYRADGTITRLVSDATWQWSNDGPLRFADNKDGEIVDSRLVPSYAGKARQTGHPVVPAASNNVPVREFERFPARQHTTPAGKTVLDFGQNLAGYVSFQTMAKEGQRVRLRFGEVLDENGEFTQANIQLRTKNRVSPLQQVDYICHEGYNAYKTSFAIFGFRYVLVESEAGIRPENITAIAVYSGMEETGRFSCSNELLNQFVKNTVWSAKSNSCDLPTDCPTRERHGWSGDAQVFCQTAGFLFDYLPFADKYLRDLFDWQKKSGRLPQIAPEGGTDFYMRPMNGAVGWADAGVLMPYMLWKQYGDTDILRKYLPGMRRYARFMQKRCGKWYPTAQYTGIHGKRRRYLCNCGQAYGEWAEPADVHQVSWKDFASPHPEVSTAYTAHVMDRMAEIEEVLGNDKEAAEYRRFAGEVRLSYQALAEKKRFTLDTDRQARLVRPLAFRLLNQQQAAFAKKRLIQALDNYGWRLGTGFLSTPLILDVLAEIDLEAAYRLLENEELPGWLFMPKHGATTIWEAWEGNATPSRGIASLNHYSKGAVCRWLFDTLCGIRVAGENRFVIMPRPGGSLEYASAEYLSVYGLVASAWERAGQSTMYTVTIPANCEALVLLPGAEELRQGPGTCTYHA